MNPSKILYEIEKIIPFKKIAPVFIIMGIISLFLIIGTIFSDSKTNKYFYEAAIIGEIKDSCQLRQYIWYKIGEDWFILLSNRTDDLLIGDSIYKKANSNMIERVIKYKGEIKDIGFKTSRTIPSLAQVSNLCPKQQQFSTAIK